ncbi:MAG: mycothiol conjugate amidase Mca [Actinomycetota bacterium]|nr:mycothiol conjugate amidase Mca [Actinomycetota bacterium]
MSRTLLAFHAHPDDESSKGAGTVSRYASEGVRCVLVTATGGEAGDVLNPAMDRPEIVSNLKATREAELALAAEIQGYDEVILLGYRDSGMPDSDDNADPRAFCNQDRDDVLETLVTIVRRVKPDVMLGYDAHEFYPHPDHLRVHEMSALVFDAAGDPSRFPNVGEPWQIKKLYAPMIFTKTRITTIHEAMIERTGSSPYERWMSMMDERAGPGRDVSRINVKGFVEQSRDALRAHRTQIDPAGHWFQVPTELIEEIYPWEDFEMLESRVGWSSDEEDLFDGIE